MPIQKPIDISKIPPKRIPIHTIKYCNTCKKYKPKTKFYRKSQCDECRKKYSKNWYNHNKNRWKKYLQKYLTKPENRKKHNARTKAQYHIPLKNKCQECGTTKNLGRHHKDHNKALQVTTLCQKCNNKKNKITHA